MRSVFLAKPDALALRLRTAGVRQVWVWLPAVLMMTVIFFESSDTFSAAHTGGWLRPIFERVFGRFTDSVWGVLHFLFRKGGHFLGYGLVCLSFVRAWLLTLGRRVGMSVVAWRVRSCLLGIACAATVASLDEWHQTYLPSRTGLFSDVVLDTVGATTMCLVVWVVCGWRGGSRQRPGRGARYVEA